MTKPAKTVHILVLIIILFSFAASLTGVLWQGHESEYIFTSLRGEEVRMQGSGLYKYDSASMAAQAIAQDFVTLILGIPVLRSKDTAETANLIVYIGRQIESIACGGLHRQGYRPKGKRKRQLFILQGLPGVGPQRAGRLLDRFGSVEAAISASSSELQSVDGFGKSIADKIKWSVSERMSPYFTRPFISDPRAAGA